MRQMGRVMWFNDARGHGLIRLDRGDDVPVRAASIQGPGLKILEVGQAVEFEIVRGPRGPEAERVTRAGHPRSIE